jgi:predicted RNA binding protein YcfA (HicA-like mRNA interferase family)
MKRRALLSHLQGHGCVPVREGASHSIWGNPQTGRKEAVPRHTDIKKHLARSICRRLAVPIPPGD